MGFALALAGLFALGVACGLLVAAYRSGGA